LEGGDRGLFESTLRKLGEPLKFSVRVFRIVAEIRIRHTSNAVLLLHQCV